MSAGEPEKATGSASVEDEDWLYGEDSQSNRDVAEAAGDDDENKTETEIFRALVGDVEDVNRDNQDGNADSNSDSDDNLRVTIGNIKTDRIQSTNSRLSLKTSVSGANVREVALVAIDGITGTPALGVEGDLGEKPWRRPGADLSDYFNYGFNEDTWKTYCDKQRKLRMSLEFMTLGSSEKSKGHHDVSKSDLSSRKLKSSSDVIGGQTATIICVEGRGLNSTDGSSMQVQSFSEHPVDAEPSSSKLPPFFPSMVPPPPFSLLPINTTAPFLPRPPPRFPPPSEVPPPFTSGGGRSGGSYSSQCAPYYPFAAGVYPHTLGPMNPWLGVSDHAKEWKYHSDQDKHRERTRERARERERGREPKKEQERQRDQENTPAFPSRSSDKECTSRHRDHSDRERDRHRDREREREDHHREKRHRDRDERHKSSRSSSSWRKHFTDDGESHRRHRSKRSKRNRESTDTGSTD